MSTLQSQTNLHSPYKSNLFLRGCFSYLHIYSLSHHILLSCPSPHVLWFTSCRQLIPFYSCIYLCICFRVKIFCQVVANNPGHLAGCLDIDSSIKVSMWIEGRKKKRELVRGCTRLRGWVGEWMRGRKREIRGRGLSSELEEERERVMRRGESVNERVNDLCIGLHDVICPYHTL